MENGEWIKRKYPYTVTSEKSALNGFLQKIFFPAHLLCVYVNVKLRKKNN